MVVKLHTYNLLHWVINWIIDFLTNRKQRVKLNQDVYSDWAETPAVVPQGMKLGPWLYLMINELVSSSGDMWKFVDDTTVDELVSKYSESRIQITVNNLLTQISELKFQLNEKKCKELRIGFGKPSAEFDPVVVNDIPLDVVPCAKILALTVSSSLKLDDHIYQTITKARKRLYFLTQLK